MKFVCSICGNAIDEKDIILDIKDVGSIRLGIVTYCSACWKNKEDRTNEI